MWAKLSMGIFVVAYFNCLFLLILTCCAKILSLKTNNQSKPNEHLYMNYISKEPQLNSIDFVKKKYLLFFLLAFKFFLSENKYHMGSLF